ncbi:MAG: aminopeptidase [Anaerolineales bacterium]|nr:aminopeptidase [Anaerolineales bacterium]
MDKRWKQLGQLLVDYSTGVRAGERVMIAMAEVETYPLAHAVYEAAIRAGAYPQVQFLSESLRHALLKYGNEAQLRWLPEVEAFGMEWADVYFGLRGGYDLDEHADIPAERLALNQTAVGQISSLRWQKTRWCLVRVPNAAFARQAGTDLETITDMFFNACFLDWEIESQQWRRRAEKLNRGKQVRMVGRETDLSFSVEGRKWLVFDGRINMPDGEIYTAPVNETLNGYIYFEFPGVMSGRLVHDIRLRWQAGQLVEATSATHQDFLRQLLQTDAGASLPGEFAFGLNPHVNRFCKDILLDEKMGGTIHLALGRAYPECGGTNQSALHWDIVKDMRREGRVYLDDMPIFENGKLMV